MGRGGYYDHTYQRQRALMLDPPVPCAHCQRSRATTLDHDPPLAMHVHRKGTGCCRLIPSCEDCNRGGGVAVANGTWRPGTVLAPVEVEPERDGLPANDLRWDVPWLRPYLDVPEEAVWPRLMTVPHPEAVGSLGPEVIGWAEAREGRPLRWWQRLVLVRMLEVNGDGALCWEEVLLTLARQVGKSWLLRELCLWRMHQGHRFGEPQDVLHTGKDLAICKEVQRPARIWAKARSDHYAVREVNGQESIERIGDGSRWMLRAREGVYGYAASFACVDEAWKVRGATVDEGLVPTMAERRQPQLLLVSTAHRLATGLFVTRRQAAVEALEEPTEATALLLEWSAPAGAADDDPEAWRAASPHWTDRRRRMITGRLEALQAGTFDDPDDPDPEASFRSQWLNTWPRRFTPPSGPTALLLPDGVWDELAEADLPAAEPGLWVALEDDVGFGAAIAAARRLPDGRLELDAWLRADWDSAIMDLEGLAGEATIRRVMVGASLSDRLPPRFRSLAQPCAGTQTKAGLALLRDLALAGGVAHDGAADELNAALRIATVREADTGLFLVAKGPVHLVKALVWAAAAAHRPTPAPAIH